MPVALIGYRRPEVSETEIRHDLFVYETDAALIAQVERFLVAGLEADEAAMVVASGDKQRLMREAFGPAAELVTYTDSSEVYTRPEETMATFDAVVRRSVESLDAGLRVYGELPLCRTQAEWDGWIVYESAVNRAFANRPVVLMCGYDSRVVPEQVIHQAWQAHRVVHSDVWQLSPEYQEPEVLVRSLAPAFEALPGLWSLPVGDDLHERLADELAAEGLPEPRARDLLVAAREVISNAELYGNGVRGLRAGRVGERYVCEISDRGNGLRRPARGVPAAVAARDAGDGALGRPAAHIPARPVLHARRSHRAPLDVTCAALSDLAERGAGRLRKPVAYWRPKSMTGREPPPTTPAPAGRSEPPDSPAPRRAAGWACGLRATSPRRVTRHVARRPGATGPAARPYRRLAFPRARRSCA